MVLNFNEIPCERQTKPKYKVPQPDEQPSFRTVADELNDRLGLLQARTTKCKPIKPLAKSKPTKVAHTYKVQCICPQYSPGHGSQVACQHTGQIIIDRDVLTKEEHLCFLATPKKDPVAPTKRYPAPVFVYKKVTIPTMTARVEKLAEPHPVRIKETLRRYKTVLPERNTKALKQALEPKPQNAVESMSMEKALELMEEEQRLKRVARQLQRRRCRNLRKRILKKQRKQIRKIVCVLFEEMKDFLLNDQFIIDESSPLCAVILERIKDFTDEEFYTTTNLREYQRILANNLTVWINKFISNLNIHLAPPPAVPQRRQMHAQEADTFVPVSDYISVSDYECEYEGDDGMFDDVEDTDYIMPEDYINETVNTDTTIQPNEED